MLAEEARGTQKLQQPKEAAAAWWNPLGIGSKAAGITSTTVKSRQPVTLASGTSRVVKIVLE
jgi:hypothetical protein